MGEEKTMRSSIRLAIEGTWNVEAYCAMLKNRGFEIVYRNQSALDELVTPKDKVARFAESVPDIGIICNATRYMGYSRFLQNYATRKNRAPLVILSNGGHRADRMARKHTPYVYRRPSDAKGWNDLAAILERIAEERIAEAKSA